MKKILAGTCFCLCCCFFLPLGLAQTPFKVQGNGLFSNASSTNVDIKNTDDNTNALIRFGDNNLLKASAGFNGNDDAFKISMANTLGREDFTLSPSGRIGINSLPATHRMFIRHNSTSGVSGSAHLTLEETSSTDFNRFRFQNADAAGLWTIAARATDGNSLMNFFYNDGNNFANLMSLDGDLFRVGIHQTAPQAYLHIKQQNPGVDALKFENDDATGGETWGWRVGDNDILIYFEGDIRGGFNSDDGVYNNFPPPAAFSGGQNKYKEAVLEKVLQLNPVRVSSGKAKSKTITLNPAEVEKVNPDWVTHSEDGTRLGLNYQQFAVLAIKSIQEQQELIEQQEKQINRLEAEKEAFAERLARIEEQLAGLVPTTGNKPTTPLPAKHPGSDWQVPPVHQLKQNTPNPFREETLIRFSVPETAVDAVVQITNLQGHVVKKFRLSKGQSQLNIKAEGLQSGAYFYSLIVDGELVESKQMVLNR